MLKFYRILLLTLVAVFLASAAGIARYAADSLCSANVSAACRADRRIPR